MTIVSNTGPLIALAKADQLSLLNSLYHNVLIPPCVHRELLAKTGTEADRLDLALSTFIRVAERPQVSPEVELTTRMLDPGEREAIALAHNSSLPIIMDDRLGREAARRLGLTVTGTAGVVLQAKRENLITSVRELLEQIRDRGYWLSDELIEASAKLAGE
jgi:predicted nucleic acid-binding protein